MFRLHLVAAKFADGLKPCCAGRLLHVPWTGRAVCRHGARALPAPAGVPQRTVSSVTGDWIRPEEATSPAYWARHAREPVRFAAGIKTLASSGRSILLEVGPGVTLSTLALQTVRELAGRVFGSLPEAGAQLGDEETMLAALGKVWVSGVTPDWASVADGPHTRVSLPTYPFERRRHWIDAPVRGASVFSSSPAIAPVQATMVAVSLAGSEQTQGAEMDGIRESIAEILQDVSGENVDPAATLTFLELGFNSLLLSQVAQQIQRRLKVKIAFRQLLGDLSTIPALERFVRAEAPAEVKRPIAAECPQWRPRSSARRGMHSFRRRLA